MGQCGEEAHFPQEIFLSLVSVLLGRRHCASPRPLSELLRSGHWSPSDRVPMCIQARECVLFPCSCLRGSVSWRSSPSGARGTCLSSHTDRTGLSTSCLCVSLASLTCWVLWAWGAPGGLGGALGLSYSSPRQQPGRRAASPRRGLSGTFHKASGFLTSWICLTYAVQTCVAGVQARLQLGGFLPCWPPGPVLP